MNLPDNKTFAFTILDDTDVATLESVRPVYDLLGEMGLRTTKTVWPLGYEGPSPYAGSHSLEHPGYVDYLQGLKEAGFEMAFHGARMESSKRGDTIRALDRFREVFGAYPRTCAAHALNRENLYWGVERIRTPLLRLVSRAIFRGSSMRFEGHLEDSEYFWGDLALKHIDYVRSFTFQRIDYSTTFPQTVYTDGDRKWVKRFFLTADAEHVEEFVWLLRPESQDRLERSGGVCIVSTHLGKGFVRDGRAHPEFRRLVEQLSRRNGWFVPVSELLDHLTRAAPPADLTPRARRGLELDWLVDSVIRRLRRRNYDKTEIEYLKRSLEEEGAGPSAA